MFLVNMSGFFLGKIKIETITGAFQKTVKESNCQPNKIWVVKGSEVKEIMLKMQ